MSFIDNNQINLGAFSEHICVISYRLDIIITNTIGPIKLKCGLDIFKKNIIFRPPIELLNQTDGLK